MTSIDRRSLLHAGLLAAGGAALTACGGGSGSKNEFISPNDARVRTLEACRRTGAVRDFQLTATQGRLDLGGKTVSTWSYNGRLPGPEIRVTAGEVVRARLTNTTAQDTTVHWHGLALTNEADGVPDVTQAAIKPGAAYTYEFAAAHPGTYWFHPHSGTQLDRGLYAPLIVEDPHEPLGYDAEWIVVLDDWLDGVTGTPDGVLAELRHGMGGMQSSGASPNSGMSGMSGMDMGGSPSPGTQSHMLMGAQSDLLGGDAGDVRYPHFLINGRLPQAPATFTAKPGTRLRIRFINAAADTAFRVALGGHQMTVTHTDGYPVRHAQTEALLLGMGERYDVLVTVKDGAFPLVAVAEGKDALARAVLRSSPGAATPGRAVQPKELSGRLVRYPDLSPADTVRLPAGKIDRTIRLELTGDMMSYNWAINGTTYDPKKLYGLRSGERVRLSFVNRTTMWHPMHLHGHTFAVEASGLRKDTAIVLPKSTLNVDFDADNPGRWMIHCHNVYHQETGMMTLLGYLR